jgi:hypothetical protein
MMCRYNQLCCQSIALLLLIFSVMYDLECSYNDIRKNSCRYVSGLQQTQVRVNDRNRRIDSIVYNNKNNIFSPSQLLFIDHNNVAKYHTTHQVMASMGQSQQTDEKMYTSSNRKLPVVQSVLDTISYSIQHININSIVCILIIFLSALSIPFNDDQTIVWAAPPYAVIAEELGYYPIRNPETGTVIYVPQRIKRDSTNQAIELATKLKENNVYMAGTYWCPHTTRQKELFGKQAFNTIQYLECSSAGYQSKANICMKQKVDGYPTWIFPDGTQISGERPLSVLASAVGMKNFNEQLEINTPPLLGSESCK